MANVNALVNLSLDFLAGFAITSTEMTVRPTDPVLEQAVQPVVVASGPVSVAAHRQTGVHLLVGEGATLAGVAKFVIERWRPPEDWSATLDVTQYENLGLALYRFATEVAFGAAQEPTADNLATNWLTGTVFAIPALLDTTGPTPRLVIDADQLQKAIAGTVPAPVPAPMPAPMPAPAPVRAPLARVVTGSLHAFSPYDKTIPYYTEVNHERVPSRLPEPAAVTAERAAVLAGFTEDPAAATTLWRQRLPWNPYAAALPIVHLLASTADGPRADLVNALFGSAAAAVDQQQLARIARTSGGLAVLRIALLTTVGLAATADARGRIAPALGITAGDDLRARDVAVPVLEPPAPPRANLNSRRVTDLTYSPSFLGRPVSMTWTTYKQDSGGRWEGPSGAGSIVPCHYFTGATNPDREALKAVGAGLSDEQLRDRLAVTYAIFDIEGYADAVRAADRALISFGMQQFSFHVEEEGTVLLRRFRGLSDVWFDVFFRSAGIEVGAAPLDVGGRRVNVAALQENKVGIGVPEIGRPVASSATATDLGTRAWLIRLAVDGRNHWCVPGTVGLRDGHRALPPVSTEVAEQHVDCHDAFGFQQHTAGPVTEAILARWAVAARLVPEAIRAQLEMSVFRFERMVTAANESVTAKVSKDRPPETHSRWEWAFANAAGPAGTPLQSLFPSPAHVAAVLDSFINTPAAPIGAARRAYDRALAGWEAEMGAPATRVDDPRFRLRLLLAFLSERRYFPARVAQGDFSAERWYRRGGTINTVPDRVSRLLDRMEELTPVKGLGPRSLTWTGDFHW